MIGLTHLFAEAGLAPKDVVILLHTPKDVSGKPSLRRMLPGMVKEQAHLFETYQSSHNVLATKTLKNRRYVASFVVMADSTLLLAGVYAQTGWYDRPIAEIRKDPNLMILNETYGACHEVNDADIASLHWFDLKLTEHLADYRGRLRIKARNLTQTYARRAEGFDGAIVAIEREDLLAAHAPDWDAFIVTAAQVRNLTPSWASRLKEWCGVYLIVDTNTGERYVGSAYGDENLYRRWKTHVAGEKGVTAELARCDTSAFRFSILQLLAKGTAPENVVAVESNWKERLGTRVWGLNDN